MKFAFLDSLKRSWIALILLMLFFSCQPAQEKSLESFYITTDSYNRVVSLDTMPRRIISLSPCITEIFFLLDAQHQLVGISNYCTYPPETSQFPKVGGMQNINKESLLKLNPDLILIGSIVSKEEVEMLEKLNIPVIAIKEETNINGLFHAITEIAKITNRTEIGRDKIKFYKSQLEEIKCNNDTLKHKPTVYYVVGFGDGGDYTAPEKSHINEIISMANGKNIGSSLTGWSISREFLFEQDPDLIFIRKEDLSAFISTYPYTLLNAVKNHRVYAIESGWIDIVSPRNINAIRYINSKIEADFYTH